MPANAPVPKIDTTAFLLQAAWHVVEGESPLAAFNVVAMNLGNHNIRYKVFVIFRRQAKQAWRFTFTRWDDVAAFLSAPCPRTFARLHFAGSLPSESRYPVVEKDVVALGGAIAISVTDLRRLRLVNVRDSDYDSVMARIATFHRDKRNVSIDNFLNSLPVAC